MEDNEIDCYLTNENFANIMPHYNVADGGIKLFVDEENADRAIELFKLSENKKEDKMTCPICGSTNLEFRFKKNSFLKWTLALIACYPLALARRSYYCKDCGN